MSFGMRIWSVFEKILRFFCVIFFKLFRKELTEKKWRRILQFFKFGLIGVSSTVINYGCYLILISLNVQYVIANVIGFTISVINSFLWNNHFVFKAQEGEQKPWYIVLTKVFLSYSITGLFLNNIILIVWVDLLHLPKALGPLAALITIPINFLMNKLWAYNDKS